MPAKNKNVRIEDNKTTRAIALPSAAMRQLGQRPDTAIASEFGLKVEQVRAVRVAKGIARSGTYYWTPKSSKLLGTASDVVIAKRLGTKPSAVLAERKRLGIPPCHHSREAKRHAWTKSELAMLGKESDFKIAKQIGLDHKTVREKRQLLGISSVNGPTASAREWTKRELALLGKIADIEVGRRIGRHRHEVSVKRRSLGITNATRIRNAQLWTSRRLKQLGRISDAELAQQMGITQYQVKGQRVRLGIPAPALGMWSESDTALLGTMPDDALAKRLKRTPKAVARKRWKMNIRIFRPTGDE